MPSGGHFKFDDDFDVGEYLDEIEERMNDPGTTLMVNLFNTGIVVDLKEVVKVGILALKAKKIRRGKRRKRRN